MRRAIGMIVVIPIWLAAWTATPAAQEDPAIGNWRGTLTSGQGMETPLVITIMKRGDGYGGLTSGLSEGTEVPLTSVTVDGSRVSLQASAKSDLGAIVFTSDLTLEGNVLKGTGRVAVGPHAFDVSMALQRRARADVPQPQVEQRLDYFVGRWTFDYTGGEYPPLSAGTRTGAVTFTRQGTSDFVEGRIEGDLLGDKYSETMTIGFDPATNMMVVLERLANGTELVSVGDWRSPIAINFKTGPVQAEGRTYQLRRVISVTSDLSFQILEEFSVDGGPFRRLGNGTFAKVQ